MGTYGNKLEFTGRQSFSIDSAQHYTLRSRFNVDNRPTVLFFFTEFIKHSELAAWVYKIINISVC